MSTLGRIKDGDRTDIARLGHSLLLSLLPLGLFVLKTGGSVFAGSRIAEIIAVHASDSFVQESSRIISLQPSSLYGSQTCD